MKTITFNRGVSLKEGAGDHYFVKIKKVDHEYVMDKLHTIKNIDLMVRSNPQEFSDKELNEWESWATSHCTLGKRGPQTMRDYLHGTYEQHIMRPDKDFSTRQIPHLEAIINRWSKTKIEFKDEIKHQIQRARSFDRFFH